MQYVLVLQWPAASEADFDALIDMEDALESGIPAEHGFVDGPDLGSGEMNIFVHTDLPLDAFRDAEAALRGNPRWGDVRVAYRPAEGDEYTVVWPEGLRGFSVA